MNKLNDVDFMEFIGKQESQYIESISSCRKQIIARIKDGVENGGDELPWSKTHDNFRLRSGEVTLWAGINGHGKSLVLSHVVAHLMKAATCLLASLEMTIPATAQRMIRQITGIEHPTVKYINTAIDWTDDRLWVYDQLDTIPPDRIFGMVCYVLKELKIKHIVIDSLMKCGIYDDDYNKQKEFVDRLCWAVKTYGGHVHLVHHIRKGDSEKKIPDKFDIKGSGAIVDLVDNVVIVWRNKTKEDIAEDKRDDGDPDSILNVVKQRHGEWEGKIYLWFDKMSQQFLPHSACKPERFDIEHHDKN